MGKMIITQLVLCFLNTKLLKNKYLKLKETEFGLEKALEKPETSSLLLQAITLKELKE